MARVGLIGLGIVGTAFARNLLEDGDVVYGYDRDATRSAALSALGGTPVSSPKEVAEHSDLILSAVATHGALRDIATGPNGLVFANRRGFILVDVSTLPLAEKEPVRVSLEAAGIPMLDCTISGMGRQIEQRDGAFMMSGNADAMKVATPVLARIGKAVHDVGVFGNGIKMKLITNLMTAIHVIAAAEALSLAEKAQLNLAQVLEVGQSGGGNSRMWEVRGPLMAERRYREPAGRISLWLKDLDLITEFARGVGAATPLLDLATAIFNEASEAGLDDWDAAAVHAVIERMTPSSPGL